jgi:hypothetical protein
MVRQDEWTISRTGYVPLKLAVALVGCGSHIMRLTYGREGHIHEEEHHERNRNRKYWGSGSVVLVCSRLFSARGTANGPQRRAKGTAGGTLRGFTPDVQALELRVGPPACSVPSVPTLVKIAATTGIEFAFDVVLAGREPTLVRNAFKDTQAHVYAGGSILVASR